MGAKKKKGKVIHMSQSTETMIRTRARGLEIGTCWINSNWKEIAEATILVSRKHKQGSTTFGIFLVDLALKGIKDTFYDFNMPAAKYSDFLQDYLSKAEHYEADYNLAHNIIYEAIEFGKKNGYQAHKDFSVSQFILKEDTDDVPFMQIEFGIDGSPTLFDEIDDEDDEDENLGQTIIDDIFSLHKDVVCHLPEITINNISSEYIDVEEFDHLINDWETDEWIEYFDRHKNNIPLQFLDYTVVFAFDYYEEFLDYDHFGYHFGSHLIKRKIKHKKLDEMNLLAAQAIEKGDFDSIPYIYQNKLVFSELFPQAKTLPILSAVEMLRIFSEYAISTGDYEEAYCNFLTIEVLLWENYPEEVMETHKKLLVHVIQLIKDINLVSLELVDEDIKSDQFPGLELPDPDVWKVFYTLCDKIFVLKPWKQLHETDVFGIRLPDSGDNYFASVMGSNEEAYAIAFYKGMRGIMEFWNLQQEMLELPPESILLISQIMVTWNDRQDVDPKQHRVMKLLNLNYRGKNAWPVVFQTIPGYVPFTPTNETMEKVNILMAQTLDVITRELKTGKVIDHDVTDKENYLMRIPTMKSGKISWSERVERINERRPAPVEMNIPKELTARYNQLPVGRDDLEVDLNLVPFPIAEENTGGVFPFILMGVDPAEDFVAMMQMITAKPDFDTMVRNLPATFMNKFIEQGYRPTKVSFKSLHLFATLDFLNKHTSTKANLAIRLPAHQSALESLLEDMSKRH